MGGLDAEIADAVLSHALDILRLEAGTRARVIALLNELQLELVSRLANEDLTAFSKARLQTLLKQVGDVVDSYYLRAQGELDLTMTGVADVSASHTVDTFNTVFAADFSASLPSATFLERIASNVLIQGAPSAEWWSRQSLDTVFRFSNAVRQGMVAGDTNEQIVARIAGSPRKGISGIMDVSRTNARALVHTSIQEVANESRMETFRKNADVISAVQQLSTMDSHTTEICIAYSGMKWTLDGEPLEGALPFNGGPPRHWGCRSVLVPVTKTFAELGVNLPELPIGKRASSEGPIAANTTFEQFLSRRTTAQQDEQLGVGRAQLWRDGKITLTQLLDLQGNPLSLEQLRAKYE